MKQLLFGLLVALSITVDAHDTEYQMRVDGLSCPFCAYGIEKKLKAISGVKTVDVDLERGLVLVNGSDINLSDDQMKVLFQDAGFTFRSMEKSSVTLVNH